MIMNIIQTIIILLRTPIFNSYKLFYIFILVFFNTHFNYFHSIVIIKLNIFEIFVFKTTNYILITR